MIAFCDYRFSPTRLDIPLEQTTILLDKIVLSLKIVQMGKENAKVSWITQILPLGGLNAAMLIFKNS